MSEQVSQETTILRHIRDHKKGLLDKAFIALMGLPRMIDVFRQCYEISENREPKDLFNLACNLFHQKIEKNGYGPASLITGKIKKLSQGEYPQFIAKCQMIADNMLRVSFNAPTDNNELLMHLGIMYILYEIAPISWPPTMEEICLGFSFAKLLSKAHIKIGSKFTHAEREETRKAEGIKAQQEKMAKEAQPVIEAFKNLQFSKHIFPKGASLHKVAQMIEVIFKSKCQRPPSIDTIKRVLRGNKEIWEQFKEIKVKGRKYFIKQV